MSDSPSTGVYLVFMIDPCGCKHSYSFILMRPQHQRPYPVLTELWYKSEKEGKKKGIVQELCESRGGRPGLSVLTNLLVSVDVKLY